jgi:hypothetical protein
VHGLAKKRLAKSRIRAQTPVWFPTVSLLGFSTPTEFYAGITQQNLSDGMMARLTIIEATNQPNSKDALSIVDVPSELIAALKKAYESVPNPMLNGSDRLAAGKPMVHVCRWSDEAKQRWEGIRDWQKEALNAKPDYDGLISRTAEQTQKYATVRAVSRNPASPLIEVEDIEWGYSIVRRSITTIKDAVKRHLVSSDFELLCNAILEAVKAAGEDGIKQSDLMRARGVKSNIKSLSATILAAYSQYRK